MANAYPQIVEYNEAVQNPATAFLDAELRGGQVSVNALGLPIALSGGFALTYMVATPQRRFAVRCFHRQVPEVETKYSLISQTISSLRSPYFVDFAFLGKGIRVARDAYPVVKMAWVEGDPLGVWLDKHYRELRNVQNVRTEFQRLAKFLELNGLAHGDLQNGNVMVSPSGIRLIDYDGMYVPGLPMGHGSEMGHKHFQHPDRTTSTFGPRIDRFAFCAIDLSLQALAEDTSLHQRFREGGETILFRANDFVDPANSPIFTELRKRPALRESAERFASICQADIDLVPTLEDFVAGRNVPQGAPIVVNGDSSPARLVRPRPSGYISAFPVLNATDFEGVLRRVGDRIELIGQIVGVKHGVGKRGRGRGKKYAFVNFGPWRGDIVKLTIWSEGLAQLTDAPDESWIEKWVSVVGLVDQPYKGQHYGFYYTHVGITIEGGYQINVISAKEAKFRLAPPPPVSPSPVPTGPSPASRSKTGQQPQSANANTPNGAIISGITGIKSTQPNKTPTSRGPSKPPSNAEILNRIRQGTPTPASQPVSSPPAVSPPPAQRWGHSTGQQTKPPREPSLVERLLHWFGL